MASMEFSSIFRISSTASPSRTDQFEFIGITPFRELKGGVGLPVAGSTKRDQVRQVVRGTVVIEEAERAPVMHVPARSAALLTDPTVTRSSLALLRLPVRTTIAVRPASIAGVQVGDSIGVSTFTRAKLPAADLVLKLARVTPERRATSDAGKDDAALAVTNAPAIGTPPRAGRLPTVPQAHGIGDVALPTFRTNPLDGVEDLPGHASIPVFRSGASSRMRLRAISQ